MLQAKKLCLDEEEKKEDDDDEKVGGGGSLTGLLMGENVFWITKKNEDKTKFGDKVCLSMFVKMING